MLSSTILLIVFDWKCAIINMERRTVKDFCLPSWCWYTSEWKKWYTASGETRPCSYTESRNSWRFPHCTPASFLVTAFLQRLKYTNKSVTILFVIMLNCSVSWIFSSFHELSYNSLDSLCLDSLISVLNFWNHYSDFKGLRSIPLSI